MQGQLMPYLEACRSALVAIVERERDVLSPRSAIEASRVAAALRLCERTLSVSRTGPDPLRGEYQRLLDDLLAALRAEGLADPIAGEDLHEDGGLAAMVERVARRLDVLAAAKPSSRALALRRAALVRTAFALENAFRAADRSAPAEDGVVETSQAGLGRTIQPEDIQSLVRAASRNPLVNIRSVQPMFTHSSKEVFLVGTDGGGEWPLEAILRREPGFAIVESSLPDEFDVLSTCKDAGLPVPRPLMAGRDAVPLGGRFILMERVGGQLETLETLGTAAGDVLKQSATFLAHLHRIPPTSVPRFAACAHRPVRDLVGERITRIQERWTRERTEPSAMIQAALMWLGNNLDRLTADPAIVHGDFDLRNMLIANGKISAGLDWEMSRLGHRAEDLGYIRQEVCRAMDWDEYVATYENAGGRPINDFDVSYFEVLAWTWRLGVVVTAFTGYERNDHRDFMLLSTRFVEYEHHLDCLAGAMTRADITANTAGL